MQLSALSAALQHTEVQLLLEEYPSGILCKQLNRGCKKASLQLADKTVLMFSTQQWDPSLFPLTTALIAVPECT